MSADLRLKILTRLQRSAGRTLLQKELESCPESWIQSFGRTVDESPYCLEDWIDALLVFQNWGARQKRHLPLEKQVEYLICCIDGLKSATASLHLSEALTYYLEKNGVDP